MNVSTLWRITLIVKNSAVMKINQQVTETSLGSRKVCSNFSLSLKTEKTYCKSLFNHLRTTKIKKI